MNTEIVFFPAPALPPRLFTPTSKAARPCLCLSALLHVRALRPIHLTPAHIRQVLKPGTDTATLPTNRLIIKIPAVATPIVDPTRNGLTPSRQIFGCSGQNGRGTDGELD